MTQVLSGRTTAIHECNVGWARGPGNRWSRARSGASVKNGLLAPLESMVELPCASSNCILLVGGTDGGDVCVDAHDRIQGCLLQVGVYTPLAERFTTHLDQPIGRFGQGSSPRSQ